MSIKRFSIRALALLLALAALLLLILVIAVEQFGSADQAQNADVIVLLGSFVLPGGKPGPALERRAQHTAALYQRGLARRVICSGGVVTNPPAEAVVACGRLVKLGVPPETLIVEDQSLNTEQNAAYTAHIMRANGWRSVVVVSDGYHLLRAKLMFDQQGVIAYPSPAETTVGPMNRLERIAREMREALGISWYAIRRIFGLISG